jgi:alpha-1,6-mannosyltransferase
MTVKTLHVTNSYHPTSGGIRTFYSALLEGANRLGRQMRLVVPGESDRVEEVGEYGRIYYLRAPKSPIFDSRYRLILPHTFLVPGANGLRHILRIEKPDVVEVNDKYSLCWLAGALRKGWIPGVTRPTLVGVSCERMDDSVRSYIAASPLALRLAALYLAKAYVPLFDCHIAVSRYVADELTGASADLNGRLQVLPMGVHIEQFGPQHRDPKLREQLLRESGGDDSTVLLLYAGRLSREKNLALLVEMMDRLTGMTRRDNSGASTAAGLPNCRLLIAGGGPLQDWLQREGVRLNGRIRLLGHVGSKAELARLVATADAFVHPNPREPFGIGPLEAMASGTPLVVPDSGGVLEYAGTNTAWLARPDGLSFALAVLKLVSAPDEARAKAERARGIAERHNWQRIAGQFFEAYEACHLRRIALQGKTAGICRLTV